MPQWQDSGHAVCKKQSAVLRPVLLVTCTGDVQVELLLADASSDDSAEELLQWFKAAACKADQGDLPANHSWYQTSCYHLFFLSDITLQI